MKEGNVLFNDPLKAFLFTGIWRYMVKDHSCNKKGNSLVAYLFNFCINSKGYFTFMILCAGWYIPCTMLHQLWSSGCSHNTCCG